jgi:primosomal protein N'
MIMMKKYIQQKYEIETDCLKFIKMKGKKFFTIYFNLAKENKLNLKYFIETELDEYYKKYETPNYNLFKSFQKFQLNEFNKYQNKQLNYENFREMKQTEYMNEIKTQLELSKKCFIKAPTGFGKTVLYYKTISKLGCKKILILTPRKMLNKQIVESKYTKY